VTPLPPAAHEPDNIASAVMLPMNRRSSDGAGLALQHDNGVHSVGLRETGGARELLETFFRRARIIEHVRMDLHDREVASL